MISKPSGSRSVAYFSGRHATEATKGTCGRPNSALASGFAPFPSQPDRCLAFSDVTGRLPDCQMGFDHIFDTRFFFERRILFSALNANSPILCRGSVTVASAGWRKLAKSMSSSPTTENSSGMETPAAISFRATPIAVRSLLHMIAVGIGGQLSRVFAAPAPPSTLWSPSTVLCAASPWPPSPRLSQREPAAAGNSPRRY